MTRLALLIPLAFTVPALAADTPKGEDDVDDVNDDMNDDSSDDGLVPTGRDRPAQRPRVEPTPTTPELPKPDEVSPEAKRTVDAFEGNWNVTGMSTDDAGNPVQITASVTCKEIVEGAAVACDSVTTNPDGTREVEHLVYGLGADGAEVHRIVVTKAGVADETTGKWVGDELVLEATETKGDVTESTTLTVREDGTLNERIVRKTAQGEELVHEVTGKRDAAAAPELPMNDRELDPMITPERPTPADPMRK